MIVQKFGGASVASPDTLQKTAGHVIRAVEAGESVAVVVSAMQGVTDQLQGYVSSLALSPDTGERDTVLSAGEQITCGLMALALQNLGLKSCSWLAWQIPIISETKLGLSRISSIETEKLKTYILEGGIPVIAGFQGMNSQGRLTTFGRGGSDITAVALAASLGADRCDFYKDVAGIMSADPSLVPKAKVIDRLSIQEMLELSALGAKVLQSRAVELAAIKNVPVRVLPNFEQGDGTYLYHEERPVEKPIVRSLVSQPNQGLLSITLKARQDCSDLVEVLRVSHISFDMLSLIRQKAQTQKSDDRTMVVLSVAKHEIERTIALLSTQLDLKEAAFDSVVSLSKLSLVGVGLQGHSEILSVLLKTLADHSIPILATCTSQCRISLLIDDTFAELALRLLHKVFNLEGGEPHHDITRTA